MDNSKEYIEMCRKAVEVQENHLWDWGDYWWNGSTILLCTLEEREPYHPLFTTCLGEIIFVPRQDQLQEMLDLDLESLIDLIWKIKEFNLAWWMEFNFQPNSMEQLWLAFVMKEKYNKVWNGSDWK